MQLDQIVGKYDLFIGLGNSCGPNIKLRQHGLRKYAFPLDWVISNNIQTVTNLIENQFAQYMEIENMERVEGTAHYLEDGNPIFPHQEVYTPMEACWIQDNKYQIISVHDFPKKDEMEWEKYYSAYKEKVDRRVKRFYQALAESKSTLVIRWGLVTQEELISLQKVFSQYTKGVVNVLSLQPVEQLEIVKDKKSSLSHICELSVPLEDPNGNDVWDPILTRFSLLEET